MGDRRGLPHQRVVTDAGQPRATPRDKRHSDATARQSGCGLWITAEQARQLIDEIVALQNRWVAQSQDDSDLPFCQFNMALAPLSG